MNKEEFDRVSARVFEACSSVISSKSAGWEAEEIENNLVELLRRSDIEVEPKVSLPLNYATYTDEGKFTAALLIQGEIWMEAHTSSHLMPIHEARMHTGLTMTGKPFGILVDLGAPSPEKGFRTLEKQY